MTEQKLKEGNDMSAKIEAAESHREEIKAALERAKMKEGNLSIHVSASGLSRDVISLFDENLMQTPEVIMDCYIQKLDAKIRAYKLDFKNL